MQDANAGGLVQKLLQCVFRKLAEVERAHDPQGNPILRAVVGHAGVPQIIRYPGRIKVVRDPRAIDPKTITQAQLF